jgi:hypothetical protein
MLTIKMKPRAYRIRETTCMTPEGFPAKRWLLQCQTRMGWNTVHRFQQKSKAQQALELWQETLI